MTKYVFTSKTAGCTGTYKCGSTSHREKLAANKVSVKVSR